MPVTERLEDPGSFSIALNADHVPNDQIRLIKELGQIIVTPTWFLHPERYNDSDLLAAAKYSGVVLSIDWEEDTITLRGQGPWWYLGDSKGNGPVLGSDVTYSAASVSSILTSIASGGILPPSISAGTITTTGVGTYTGTFYASQTCLEAVRTVLTTLGMHARINPDWTMDACLATRDDVFTVTSPTVVAVGRGFGSDPTYTGIEPKTIRHQIDASNWVSESVVENVDSAGARSILSESERSVISYQDGLGNQLERAVIQSGPSSTDVGYTTFHSETLSQWDAQKEQEISTDLFEFSGAFEVGDHIYVYAPELGFRDEDNQIAFRGQTLAPLALQVPSDSWPVKTPEMGVYYRPSRTNYKQAVLGDGPLAYWRLDETSGTNAADSAGHASGPFDGTYTNTPTLNQSGVMDDGSGNASADFDGSTEYVDGADWSAMDFNSTAAFTLEAWITPDTVSGTQLVVGKVFDHDVGNQYTRGWALFLNGTSVGVSREDQPTFSEIASGGTLAADTAYHLVGTYDGATLRLHVNGVLVASTASTSSLPTTTRQVFIGAKDDTAGPNLHFDGQLDEVAVYDRALTGQEVAEHYAIGTQAGLGKRWIDLTRYVRSEA